MKSKSRIWKLKTLRSNTRLMHTSNRIFVSASASNRWLKYITSKHKPARSQKPKLKRSSFSRTLKNQLKTSWDLEVTKTSTRIQEKAVLMPNTDTNLCSLENSQETLFLPRTLKSKLLRLAASIRMHSFNQYLKRVLNTSTGSHAKR